MKQTAAIIGFGRFGKLLAEIVGTDFSVKIVESDEKRRTEAKKQGFEPINFEALGDVDVIFLAVPIAMLETVLKQLAPIVRKQQTVLDICGVKVYPAKLMQHYLPDCRTLATHPLFGPDSARNGLKGLKIALCPLDSDKATVDFWQKFWMDKGVEVIKTTPEQHDHDMIYALGLTQTLARLVGHMDVPDLALTTSGFDAVKQVTDFSLSDTDQLYHDMLYYNPFFQEMKQRLSKASSKVLHQLDHIAEEQEKAMRAAKSGNTT